MSADNYVYVGKRRIDGKYEVTHRCASVYYEDEVDYDNLPHTAHSFTGGAKGWSDGNITCATYEELMEKSPRIPHDWIMPPPTPESTHDNYADALVAAHKFAKTLYVVEYGVIACDP